MTIVPLQRISSPEVSLPLPSLARHLAATVLAAAAVLLAPHALAQSPTVVRDLPYTTDATGSYRADLYQPSTPGPHPAILAIHGGSWRSGHKTELRRLCQDLATAGYACFSIDYDTHPRSFPTSWQESRAALRFLHTHAAEYHLDPTRIVALGTSAGGQLAALLALAPEGPTQLNSTLTSGAKALPTGGNLPVAAALVFNGIYNLHLPSFLIRRYLGGNCSQIPTVCHEASPVEDVHPGAPPFFVGHGTHDHMVPYSEATSLVSRLTAAHDPVTPFIATDAGHSYWRNHHWYSKNLEATKAFLAQSLPQQEAVTRR